MSAISRLRLSTSMKSRNGACAVLKLTWLVWLFIYMCLEERWDSPLPKISTLLRARFSWNYFCVPWKEDIYFLETFKLPTHLNKPYHFSFKFCLWMLSEKYKQVTSWTIQFYMDDILQLYLFIYLCIPQGVDILSEKWTVCFMCYS